RALASPPCGGALVAERLALAGRPLGEDGRAALHVDWNGSELQADGSLLGLAKLSGGGAFDLDRADLTFGVQVDELAALAGFAPDGTPEFHGNAAGELR